MIPQYYPKRTNYEHPTQIKAALMTPNDLQSLTTKPTLTPLIYTQYNTQPIPSPNPSQYNFTPKAIVVFSEVFSDFSTAGKMSRRQLAEFISKATDFNHCSESDDRVGNFFENYSESTNGWVDLPGFLKFYLNSSLNKKSTVYDNLRSLGYNRDLRPKYAPAQEVSSGLADTFRFKIVKSARGLTAKILEDYETYKAFMLRLLRGLKEKTQGDEKEKARTSRLTVLYVNWAKKVKGFLMTLPPSPEVIQRILFEGFSKREGLKVESEVEFYEMIVLFALLFKGKEMHTMMRTLSEQKEEPAVTSNDDLDIAAPSKHFYMLTLLKRGYLERIYPTK